MFDFLALLFYKEPFPITLVSFEIESTVSTWRDLVKFYDLKEFFCNGKRNLSSFIIATHFDYTL